MVLQSVNKKPYPINFELTLNTMTTNNNQKQNKTNMKKTLNIVRYALVSLFSFLFISSAQAAELKMALFNYCNTGYEVAGWHSCQQEGGGNLNSETDNDVSVGGASIGGNFKRSFSKLVGTDLPTFATSDMQTNLGIEVPYNVYMSGVANGANTDGTITISGLNAESSYVIYAGCGHDNGNIGKSSCGFKVPSNACAEVDSLDYVVTVASSWGRSGSSTVVADSFTSFGFGESICAGADGLALIRMKGIVPKSGGTIDLVLTGERAGINFLAVKELPPPVLPETTIEAEAVKVSDINNATEFADCTSDDKVVVNLTAAKTLEFDETFAFGQAKIVYDGALKILGEAAPADLAKFDFKGVTSLDYAWLPVGSGMAINFKQDSGKLGDSDEAGIPDLTIYGNTWNNVGTSGSLDAKLFGSDGSTVLADTIPVSYNGGSYQWNNATTPYLKGYLDDSNISFKTTVPFDRYDVYIICATDTGNAKFSYKTINGVNYSANENGEAVANSTAAWGASQQLTPILGKNVMRLSGLTTQKFEITNSPKASNSERGCIAAIVIVKVAPPQPAVTATISENTTWSALWEGGTAPTANTPVELTFIGSPTLTIDTEVVAKNIKLIGDTTAQVVGIAGAATNINSFLGKVTATVDFAGKFDYRFDATSGLTADSALLDMIKVAGDDKVFTFIGSGSNGATLDFVGNDTFNTHIVFDGGTHAFKRSNSGPGTSFANNGTAENPTILVTGGTILNLYGRDFCGWNAAANPNGVVRVNSGATLNLRDYSSSNTFFFSARLYLDPGSSTHVYNSGDHLRINGGNVSGKEQIYVPESENGVATITIENNANMYIGQENNPNAGFYVGAGSTLRIVGELKGINTSRVLGKRGAGKLEITDNVTLGITVDDGSLALGGTVNSLTLTKATEIEVASGTATISAISGDFAITKTGAGTLNLPAAYTQTITLTGGQINRTATNTVVINGDIDLGTTEMPLSWTIDAASTGSIKLPTGFPFGQIAKASAIPEGLTFKDSTGATISADKLEIDGDGYIVLKKSEITTPYNVAEPTNIEGDLAFGEGGSINITHNGASLTATGTITLPESGLPITFVCEDEYVVGEEILVVAASAFTIGESDATINDFKCTLTGKLPKGMEGEFQLVELEEWEMKAIVFAITKSDYYTADVAAILEDTSLIRRFDASRGVTTGDNNKVTAWADLCGTTAAAAYTTANITDTPTFVNGELREYLDFGECNSHIDLGFEPVDNNAKTVIEVIDIKNDPRAFLMGDRQVYNFHRDQTAAGSTKCFNGNAVAFSVRDNGANEGDGKSYVLPEGFRVVSMTTSANCSTDCFSGDRGGSDNRSGGRKLSEVLIFNAVLTADQLKTVEDYLTAKWNLALKNTATISGNQNWSTITWDAGKFYAEAATEITLEGNTVLTYDATAPIGDITFTKGDFTLEQVVTANTELTANVTIPVDEVWTIQGGETEDNTFTCTGALTVNGTLKTEGYVNLDANNAVPGGTLEVVNGQATLKFASQGISGGGTLTIDAGATAIAASGDAFSYADNASFTLNVYGALNMGGYRWTYKGSSGALNIYDGAEISGAGDGNGALDMYIPINAAVNGSSTEATVSAPFKYSADTTFNVGDGMTLKLTGAVKSNQTRTLTKTGAGTLKIGASQGNVTVVANAGKVVLDNASYVKSVSTSGTGSVEIAGGEYDVGYVRDFSTIGNITTSGEGKIKVVATVADDGTVKIVNVPVGTSLVVYDMDGVTPLTTTVSGTTVTASFTIKTDGEACLYDWTFKADSLTSVGQIKSTLTWDTGYKDGQEHASERILESEDFVYGKALNTKATPYSDFTINYPTEWTCVVAGVVPNTVNAALIAFGTSTGGSIAILKGSTDTEVLIARTIGNSAYQSLATMQVANALTTSHTYAFVKTANSITVYLDGNLWNVTPVSNVSFGNRIQVGSIHGGKQNTMIESSKDATNDTAIQAVRIFEGALGPNALKQLADEFPYNSPNGTFEREFAEGDDTWTLADSWTNTKTSETVDLPAAGSTLNISAAGAASITVDLTEETDYEAMTFSGAAMTFKAGAAEAINIGLTTVASPITIEYGSISIANGPFVVSGEGSVAFDYSAAPVSTFAKIGFVALTGTTDDLGDKVTCTALPSAPAGRSISFGYSAEHKAYGVTTIADREATTLYLKSSTTLSDDTLFALTEDGEADMPRLFAEDEIVVPSDVTMTIPTTALAIPLTTPIQGAGTIAVTGATLTEASPLFTVDEDWAGAVEFTNVTVTGADLNKYGNENTTVKLTGVVGYLKDGVEFEPEVILANNNLAGLELTDGSSYSPVIFSKVSGNGNFIGNKPNVTQKIAVVDASEHIGQVRMIGGMGITLGSGEGTVNNAKIAVADDATITFAGQQWIAEGGVTFGETLAVIGEVGSFITMPEPATIPEITLIDAEGEIVEGDYMLVYAGGKLTVSYAQVEVAIPEIAGTDVVVTVEGVEEPIPVIGGYAAIPYGADMTVTYTVQPGKLFKDGTDGLEFDYYSVTEDPEIANDITEDDVTVDAGARIEDVDYLDIPAALADATDGDTVIVLQNADLSSLTLTIPEDVTLDLNEKTVLINPANIVNNGMIVIYDETTALALIDTHGTIKFAVDMVVAYAYTFPAETVLTIMKVQGIPGATITTITLPDDGLLYNFYGAAAKKSINVVPGNGASGLVLAGVIERGSHGYHTIINVGGACMIAGPLVIGADGQGMDYETYPDNIAMLEASVLMFYDDSAVITLVPERGQVQTFIKLIDNPDVGDGHIVTVEGAKIVETAVSYAEGVKLYTYTAEWIKPEATVEAMTDKPEELAAAATFKATEAGAQKYADYTASLTITSDKNVAQDAIILAGQFNATDLEDPAGINNNYDGEWIDMPLTSDLTANEPYAVIDMPWNYIAENVKTFNCGLKNIALTEETTFTVTLTIAKDDDTVLTKDIEFTIPAAKVLPTATVAPTTAEGYEAAAEFTAGNIGVGYDSWIAKFYLISDVTIGEGEVQLGGNYGSYGWVDKDYTCTAGDPVSVLATVGLEDDITVKTVFEAIQSFKCGVKNIDLKNDATFTLKLVITDGETTKEICSIDNLTVKAKSSPVVPGEDIDIPSGKDPQEYAGEVEAQKATLLKAPVELTGEALSTYQSYFTAQVVGEKVAFVLNEDGEEAVEEAVKAAEADVLSVALSADTTELTIADPLKGFYYSLKQGGELTNLGFNEEGDKNKLAGKDEVKFTLTKPEGKGFYQTIVTPVEYK